MALESNNEEQLQKQESYIVYPTVAVDAVVNPAEVLYDHFYAAFDPFGETTPISFSSVDDKSERLLECIREFDKVMRGTNASKLDRILNAAEEEEEKRRKDAVQSRVMESEKYWSDKKRKIEVAVVFLNISEVEAFNETFAAEVLISARWREPALDAYSEADLKLIDYEDFFNPNLYIHNLVTERRATITNNIHRNESKETYMLEKTLIRGVFSYSGKYATFPFDVQDLLISLASDEDCKRIDLVPHEEEISSLKRRVNVDQLSQSWRLFEHTETQMRVHKADLTGFKFDRPGLDTLVQIARKPVYYLYNMYSIIFFVTLLTVFTFVIDPTDSGAFQARLQLCCMVFLTLTNFKISVSLMMPKLPYMNSVDKYNLYNILSMSVVTAYNSMVIEYCVGTISTAQLEKLDRYAMITIFALYLGWNVVYFVWLRFSMCKKKYRTSVGEVAWKLWRDKKKVWLNMKNNYTSNTFK